MTMTSPDGCALIHVNAILPQNGMTTVQFRDAMVANISQTMPNNGFKKVSESKQVVNGIETSICKYSSTNPANPGHMIFTFAAGKTHSFVLNIVVGAGFEQHEQPAIKCALSLYDPAMVPVSPPVQPPQPNKPAIIIPQPPASGTTTAQPQADDQGGKLSMEELQQMEEMLVPMIEQKPGDPELMANLATVRAGKAMVLYEKGDITKAVEYLINSVQLDPTKPDILELLGDVLDDVPEPTAPYLAQSYYEDALELDPSLKPCRLKLAALYMSTGDLDNARVHYEILTRNAPNMPDAAYAQDLALCYLSQNRARDGITFLTEMVTLGGDPRLRLYLSILLNQQGDRNNAVSQLNQVIKTTQDQALLAYAKTLLADFNADKGGN
jgi:predicted Zn-dependent protease